MTDRSGQVDGLAELLVPTGSTPGPFHAASPASDEKRVFGGQLIGQALAAAARTAEDRLCNAMHALFVGPGDPQQPFSLAVARLRDGRNFTTRRVETHQSERLILSAILSFHGESEGPEHQVNMPDVPPPEQLRDQRDIRRENAEARGKPPRISSAESMLDARPVDLPNDASHGIEGRRCLWFRSRTRLPDDPALHQAAIAYASDMGLVSVSLRPHIEIGDARRLDAASLDHSIRFHRPARADDWLLHVQRSTTAAAGRGLALGDIFARDGKLVASVSQATLIRFFQETAG